MNDSILLTIKKLLGIQEDDYSFDTDIIVHINSAFSELTQIGYGPENGYIITDSGNKWREIATNNLVEMIKTYIYLKVKIIFDPPTNSSVLDLYKKEIERYEWRLQIISEEKIK